MNNRKPLENENIEKRNNGNDIEKKFRLLFNEISNKPWFIERKFFLQLPWQLTVPKNKTITILTTLLERRYLFINSNNCRKLALYGLKYIEYLDIQNILECCDISIKMDPKDGRNYLVRAYIHSHNKQYQDAIKDINSYLDRGKEYGEIYRWRGKIFFEQNELENSLSDFNRCTEIEPDNFMVYVNRGELYLKQKEFEKAKNDFEKHLSVFPEVNDSILLNDETAADPLSHIVCAYARQGMDSQAKEYFINTFKADEYFRFELGSIIGPLVKKLADIGHHDLAYDFLKEYKDMDFDDYSDTHKYVVESELKEKFKKQIEQTRLDERNKIIADLSHSLKNIVATVADPLENLRQTKEYVDITIEKALRGANLVREITNAMNYSLKGSIDDFYYDAEHNQGHDSQTLAGMVIASLRNSVSNMFDTKYFSTFSKNYFPDRDSFFISRNDWNNIGADANTDRIANFVEKYLTKIEIELNEVRDLSIGNEKGSAVKLLTIIQEMILNAIKYSSFVEPSARTIRIKISGDDNYLTISVENKFKPQVKAKTTGMGQVILRNFAEMLNTKLEIETANEIYSAKFKIPNCWKGSKT